MTGLLLLLSAVLAAPDGGVPGRATAQPQVHTQAAHPPDAGTPPRSLDGGVGQTQRTSSDGGVPAQATRDGGVRSSTVDGAPEPSTRIAVQEPAAPDAGTSKKKARSDRTDGQTDPQMDALLEQSRAQTEALQQIAAQQRASDEARIAEQQGRTQRAAQMEGARSSIDVAAQSLQANGNWNPSTLQSTKVQLQQTAAAASAANSPVEASRAAEAARLVEAAEAAVAQRNTQQAQYYLLQANQLLQGAQSVRY